jgi:uncharacterized protein (TIGR02145 family)
MKKSMMLIVSILLSLSILAQTPQSFRYQAVARDNSGNVLANQVVSFQISILSGSVSGAVAYSETHVGLSTNAFGLVELEIGNGTPVSDTFSAIDWGINNYFVKVEMDPAGGSTYQVLSTSQLLSVPYALYAKTAETANDAATKEYVDNKFKLLTSVLQGVQDADGNHYTAVMIGDQVWMVENLKTTKYNNGTPIPLVTDQTAWANLITPGYCWYNNDAANKTTYGGLYNGYAVLTGNLCPAGWHVPTISEFIVLKNYLISNGYNYDGSTSSNKIAKSLAATVRWTASTFTGSPGNVPSTNNSSGFSGLPGGLRAYSGVFYYVGNDGYWWSSTIPGSYGNIVSLTYSSVGLGEPSGPAKSGLCVRCLKD